MKVLVLNPGSASLKAAVFAGRKKVKKMAIKSSRYGFREIQKSLSSVDAVGIRIVHGGQYFSQPTIIGKPEIIKLRQLVNLAPLHNKVSLKLIEQIKKHFPRLKIVAVFDTAFHRTIPERATTYALPRKLSKKFGVRKYGFHGIACQNILRQLKVRNSKIPPKLIICHLGGGNSVTAVKNGKSVDTSMGFTPTAGLMMATRAGDLDPGALIYLQQRARLTAAQASEILNQQSGIYGMTGEKDFRKVIAKARAGERWCCLAVEMLVYQIVKRIFAYYGILGGCDVLTFSGGIGAGSAFIRKKISQHLKLLGDYESFVIEVDEEEEIFRCSKTLL